MRRVWMYSVVPKPFLKWAGGKGQLLENIDSNSPLQYSRYFEPFVGGGAFFFYLFRQGFKKKAFLSDLNQELVTAYLTIRDSLDDVISELQNGTYETERDAFYEIRDWDRQPDWKTTNPVRQTARMIYLNRTCYNGLYRVNKKGQFNVPYGEYKNPTICDEENLRAVSASLKSADIRCVDFAIAVKKARKGDFIYFDPPYQPLSDTAYFTDYTAEGFGLAEQKRLAALFQDLHNRGCLVLESNSAVEEIRDLYSHPDYYIDVVKAKRAISCDPEGRGEISELLIRNYRETKQQRLV